MYTRVRGQFRSSSQTPLNLISRGLACTCRNFKGESHRPRRRRFARETRTCTSPPRVVSSSLCLLLFNPKQINLACAYTTRRYQQPDMQEHRIDVCYIWCCLYLIINIIRVINFIIQIFYLIMFCIFYYFLSIFIFIFFYPFFWNGIFLRPE